MAKTDIKIGWVSVILTIFLLFAGLVTTWTLYGKNISINSTEISTLKESGSSLAVKNSRDIMLVRKDIDVVQKTQMEQSLSIEKIRAEQQVGFQRILDRLP